MPRTTYWVKHERFDCGEVYEFSAPHPTVEDRDAHLALLVEDPDAERVETFETKRSFIAEVRHA